MDEDLIGLIRTGDVSAFRLVVCRHQQQLMRIAMRLLGDRAEAEDAVQESLIRLWQARERLEYVPTSGRPESGEDRLTLSEAEGSNSGRLTQPRGSLRAFLIRIVTNLCLDQLRARRIETVSLFDNDPDCAAPSPSEVSARNALTDAVRTALLSLPDAQRAVFVLTHYEGLTYGEAADVLGCPVGTVASRKQAACLTLRRRLAAWCEEDL